LRIPKINNLFFKKSPYREIGIGWLREKIIKHYDSNDLKIVHACGKIINYKSNEELIHCLKEIFFDGIYMFESKKENPLIIDCGAHIGMSVLNFKQQYPNARIIAFEPDFTNFQILQNNLTNWKFSNVEIFQNPVWNNHEEIIFEASGAMGGKIINNTTNDDVSLKIRAIRLVDFLNKEIDFLKIDIEGAEYEVIKDCKDNLKFVKNLFVEYHSTFKDQNKLIEIISIINEAGFQFYIKEANSVFSQPFLKNKINTPFDIQLNIFAFRNA
jgi:FkbM family methyltransferase